MVLFSSPTSPSFSLLQQTFNSQPFHHYLLSTLLASTLLVDLEYPHIDLFYNTSLWAVSLRSQISFCWRTAVESCLHLPSCEELDPTNYQIFRSKTRTREIQCTLVSLSLISLERKVCSQNPKAPLHICQVLKSLGADMSKNKWKNYVHCNMTSSKENSSLHCAAFGWKWNLQTSSWFMTITNSLYFIKTHYMKDLDVFSVV